MKTPSRSGALVGGTLLVGAVAAVAFAIRSGHGGGGRGPDCEGAKACGEACSAGDPCACGVLGALYLHGSTVGRDSRKGVSMLDRACDAECATACWALGNALQNGSGLRADARRADGYFQRLNALCQKGCDEGDPDRCFTLAGSYLGEHGVAGDHAHAEELYARSAGLYEPRCAKGDAHACARMGLLEDHGLGIPAARAAATASYDKACALGDAEACEEAAKRYSGHDKELTKDEALSVERAKKACAAGRATGCALANQPDDFLRIVEAACAAGSAFDCGSAAFARFNGAHGVPRDTARAVPLAGRMIELEQDACLDDDGSACLALARPFESGTVEGEPEGTVLSRDAARVTALRQKACDLGQKSACAQKGAPPGAGPTGSPGKAP